jgi:hypothetical protein
VTFRYPPDAFFDGEHPLYRLLLKENTAHKPPVSVSGDCFRPNTDAALDFPPHKCYGFTIAGGEKCFPE